MATLKDIRLRIASVQNTQQITKAMKMVSAAKFRKAHVAADASFSYSQKMRALVTTIAGDLRDSDIPVFRKREKGVATFLVITSDKGLCGGLNVNLCKMLLRFMEERIDLFTRCDFVVIGKKGVDFLLSKGFSIREQYIELKDIEQKKIVSRISEKLMREYEAEKIDHLFLVSNKIISVINQQPRIQRLLPIAQNEDADDDFAEISSSPPGFEPDDDAFIEGIVERYLKNLCYTSLLNNFASEHGARMTAMDAATKNASEMITKLRLQYNRARQAAITTELTEIISGAESIH